MNIITYLCNNINEINSYSELLQNILDDFQTEFKRLKLLKSLGCFIFPDEYIVGQRFEVAKSTKVKSKNITAQFISLSEPLKKFFELPHTFQRTLNYFE